MFKRLLLLSALSLGTALTGCAGTPVEITFKDGDGNPVQGVGLTLTADKSFPLDSSGPTLTIVSGADGVARGEFSRVIPAWKGTGGKPFLSLDRRANYGDYYGLFPIFWLYPGDNALSPMVARDTVLLHRKGTPHGMLVGRALTDWRVEFEDFFPGKIEMPKEAYTKGTPISFDMIQGRWLQPYGTGKTADFTVTVDIEGAKDVARAQLAELLRVVKYPRPKPATTPAPMRLKYKFTFPGSDTGILPVYSPHPVGSGGEDGANFVREHPFCNFIPPTAPESGYQSEIIKTVDLTFGIETDPNNQGSDKKPTWDHVRVKEKRQVRDDVCYYVRIQRGEGVDKKTYYGVIKGDIRIGETGFALDYILNPTAGIRSIEEDPKQNIKLFKLNQYAE